MAFHCNLLIKLCSFDFYFKINVIIFDIIYFLLIPFPKTRHLFIFVFFSVFSPWLGSERKLKGHEELELFMTEGKYN